MSGLFILISGEHLGVALLTNLYAWTWFIGVIVGYFVWDLTRRNREHSFWLTYWDNRKNPLKFDMGTTGLPMPEGSRYKRVGAILFNAAPLKRKNVCVVARESRGCNTQQRTDIEYCIDVPVQTEVFLPMFEVVDRNGIMEFRIVPDYLKSENLATGWCEMTDPAFMFKPCFSDDMNQEECLRLCTVTMPNGIHDDIKLIEEYYAEDEKPPRLT